MPKRLISAGAISSALLVSGCASVSGGNVQSMVVTTAEKGGRDVAGAECMLSNTKGNWRLKTPGETTVVRSNTPMTVKCEKESLPAGMATVESATRAAMYGNILVGGLIGAAIDHSSGAAYEYPVSVKVVMGDVVSIAAPKPAEGAAPGRNQSKVHDKRFDLPPASGFADAANVNAVPSEAARKAYAQWLEKPVPRAFVLSSDGRAYWSSDTSAAVQRATDRCNERASGCQLYAYDDVVVWKASNVIEPRQRRAMPETGNAFENAAGAKQASAAGIQTVTARVTHRDPLPAPTSFAALDDIKALPNTGEKGRDLYREYLTWAVPKAIAISDRGAIARAHGIPDAMQSALQKCEKFGGPCRLYAVDGNVVFVPFPPRQHLFHRPSASNFAPADDVAAMPFVSERAREGYSQYLNLSAPKAFAISARGHWSHLGNDSRSMKTVLERCEAHGSPCWLYAVDNQVVWRAEANERIGLRQLQPMAESAGN
ncbi:hypothetical protein [Noviherbaspirillum galbum]|uniref:DUF4189 domain-containing protein n=1 Tax=Noviherbaspirillum galbum TaxID=2709383 RepID=A0A6B3SYZ3_9BURK|nr:hypothetical protein [Noviherbaspirillum galbum]NEX64172.1 hypothetical protein [Noviherbaspirillum galbum]